jgi:perosamine synthetase
VILIADACHSLGGKYNNRNVGTLADFSAFSFHPVKHITTGEGGMVTTGNAAAANRIRAFRNHGITTDHRQRESRQSHAYEMVELGFNYRISDLQCALGVTQLAKLPRWLSRRRAIAELYTEALRELPEVQILERLANRDHAYHLYVLRLASRDRIFKNLRENGIGCNVHYIPVYLHPYYRDRLSYRPGLCPVAESAYKCILSVPIFPQMEDSDVARVVDSLQTAIRR